MGSEIGAGERDVPRCGRGHGERVEERESGGEQGRRRAGVAYSGGRGRRRRRGVRVRESVVGGGGGAGAAVVEEHQAHSGAVPDAPGHRARHGLHPRHHLLAPR